LRQDVLDSLLAILRRTHVLSAAFRHLVELHEEQLALAQQQGLQDVPRVQLRLLNEIDIDKAVRDRSLHQRQVNLPTVDEVCAIYVASNDNVPPQRHGLNVCNRAGRAVTLPLLNRMTDSAHYPLLLPRGEPGFRPLIEKRAPSANVVLPPAVVPAPLPAAATVAVVAPPAAAAPQPQLRAANGSDDDRDSDEDLDNDGTSSRHVSVAQFYRYHLMYRADPCGSNHFAAPYGQLYQEYVIDQSFKIDQLKFDFLRRKCRDNVLCTTSDAVRQHIANRVQRRHPGATLGYVLRLPVTHLGSPAFYQRKFRHAMQMFSQIGRPTFMITATVNPKWEELKKLMCHGQTLPNRPDVVERVLFAKIAHMRQLVEKKGVFGDVSAYLDSLEYQKRGNPHAHTLICVEDADNTAAYVESYVCAEIPPLPLATDSADVADQKRRLRQLVLQFQVHHHSADHCLDVNGRCKRGFPKPFTKRTVVSDDRPTVYRRRSAADGGETALVKGQLITNADIVSYNPAYLLTWEGHHNVEYCYGTLACKYAVKYHLKGGSYSYVAQHQADGTSVVNYDEPVGLMKCLYRSPQEALSRIFNRRIVRMSHTVVELAVHLPGEGPVYYRRGQHERAEAAVVNNAVRLTPFEQYMR